jgi:hypothetical protein
MNRRQIVGTVGMMVFALGVVWAQDNAPPPSDSQAPQQPVPAYGQENAPAPINENPPLSGLDLPSLQEHAAPLSYLQPGATVSESANTNIGNTVGGTTFGSISRGLGNLALRRLWSHYNLRQLQNLGLEQKILWKRGQLSFKDGFSYLPEGNFGGAYGSLGSSGAAGLGNTAFGSFWGGNAFGGLGLTPRILNVSLAELSENLSPKSAVTATGGYAFTHFYGNDVNGAAFIGSSQVSAQGGYNRVLTPHTQIAAMYGYQGFDFSVLGTAFHTHVVQGMYGHRISGRMDLLVGAGPQFTLIGTPCTLIDVLANNPHCTLGTIGPIGTIPSSRLGVAAQARLRYRISKNSFELRYERFVTSGGGLFTGAQTDMVRLGVEHPLSRKLSLAMDMGYSHNDRLQPLTPQQIQTCTTLPPQTPQNACPANDARTYNSGFAGAALHRFFGREFHGFVSYQFNELAFDHSFCLSGVPCDRISNRQVITLGLDWTPRPIRID